MSHGLELRSLEGHRDEPHRGRAHRLYVALTTDCNRECPWCSTASRPGKRTYIDFDVFRKLLPRDGRFELQLEGGEPTLHPELVAFVREARKTDRCERVVLATNAVRFPWSVRDGVLDVATSLEGLATFFESLGEPLTLKVSVNHHLIERDPLHVVKVALLASLAKAPAFELVVNVRLRRCEDDDAWVVEAVREAGLLPLSNVFFLQRYGFARDDERLEPPHLVGEDFTLANPDGRTFGQDLIARSDAMDALP